MITKLATFTVTMLRFIPKEDISAFRLTHKKWIKNVFQLENIGVGHKSRVVDSGASTVVRVL